MNKTKRVSIFITLAMTVIAMMIFAGCSESTRGGTPLSQAVSGEDPVIWYECQNKIEQSEDEDEYIIEGSEKEEEYAKGFGRETRVVWIKVFKDGKLTSYSCLDNVNLGHFSKMTDEEILKELETETLTYACGQKDQPYEVYLYTDAAGQEVVFEGIPSLIKQGDKDPLYFMTLASTDTVPAFQVYDSYYGGYAIYNYDETMLREACFVTRCEKGASFGLDNMDLEGAILDYKTPEEMLHEKNTAQKTDEKSDSKADTKAKDSEKKAETEDSGEGSGEEG